MIRYSYLLLLVVLNSFNAIGQKSPDDYMREVRDWRSNENDSAALSNYLYIVEKHPTNLLCPEAYLEIADIYEKQNRHGEAIMVYRKLITIALAQKNRSSGNRYISIREGNVAARRLSDVHEQNSNYDSALYFLAIYDTVLPGNLGCGHGEREGMILRYADLHNKANRPRDAEFLLLSHSCFGASEFGAMQEKLRELFKKNEQPEYLRTEIESAINSYYLDTIYSKNEDRQDTSVYCCINFLGNKIGCSYRYLVTGQSWWDVGTPMPALVEREKMIAYLKNTVLYKMIQEL